MKDCGFILGKTTHEELARYDITEKLPGSMTEVIHACKDDEMFREKFGGVFIDTLITQRTWEENSPRRMNHKDRGVAPCLNVLVRECYGCLKGVCPQAQYIWCSPYSK